MADQKPLVLKGGRVTALDSEVDTLPIEFDYHSGISEILPGETIVVRARKQMIVFAMLTLDGTLTLDGDLWLA